MEGFGLLVGHLLGDYLLQNDWLAKNRTNPHPGRDPWKVSGLDPFCSVRYSVAANPADLEGFQKALEARDAENKRRSETAALYCIWLGKCGNWWLGHLACTAHCLLYTLAVWLCSCWWLPWWGLAACFLTHWPIDRFRLARMLMSYTGQEDFATGVFSPWSVIVVDNTLHLLTLFVIGLLA